MLQTTALCSALVVGLMTGCTLVNDFDDLRGAGGGAGGANGTGTGTGTGNAGAGGSGGGLVPNGGTCLAPEECESGACAQGFCCDDACTGDCVQCNAPALEGICSPRPAGTSCGDGVCDGTSRCASGTHLFSALVGAEGDDRARAVAFDSSGNIVVAGEFDSDEIDFEPQSPGGELGHASIRERTIFIAKLSADGELIDSAALGTQGDFVIADLATGLGGEVFLSMRMVGEMQVGRPEPIAANEWMGLVLKLDTALNYEWHHLYAGGVRDPQRIAVDGSGQVIVTGGYTGSVDLDVGGNGCCGPGNAGVGTYVMRLGGSDGSLIASTTSSALALGDVIAPGLAVAPSGEVVLAGHFTNSSMTFGSTVGNAGTENAFVARLEPDLAQGTAWSFGDGQLQRAESAAMDPTGAVWIAGSFDGQMNFFGSEVTAPSAGTDRDLFVARLDLEAEAALHAERYGPFESSTALDASIATDDDANLVLIARRGVGPVVLGEALPAAEAGWIFAKLSSQGVPLWQRVFGATDLDGTPVADRHVLMDVAAGSNALAFTGSTSGIVDYGGSPLSSAGGQDVVLAVFEP